MDGLSSAAWKSGDNVSSQNSLPVLQEYILQVLHCYAANGAALVEEITVGLPTPFPAVSLLVELLISQMLLPAPPLLVFAYQSLLVRLVETVGQALAMCASHAAAQNNV